MRSLLGLLPFQDALFNLGSCRWSVLPFRTLSSQNCPPVAAKIALPKIPELTRSALLPTYLCTLSSTATLSSGISGLNFSEFNFVVSDLTPC